MVDKLASPESISTNPSIFGSKRLENLVEQSPFRTHPADLFSSYFFDSLFMEGFSNRTSPFFDNLKGSLLRSHSIEMASAITEKGFLMFIAVKLSLVRNISVVSSLSNSIDRELFVSFNPFANMYEYSIVPNLLDNCRHWATDAAVFLLSFMLKAAKLSSKLLCSLHPPRSQVAVASAQIKFQGCHEMQKYQTS
ncbi:hypothetical protein NC653_029166 [Populus alba x Populus x berolinensis]|uniref:Uncharacterized protein n=2 Tax=Populus TaxID=3689 RepID=A0A4U5QQ98_POPAL|nr:hypothetical protein NC653_029166 [Populus alba x Populus x berolinensis]TKS12631.1 hypothetical protein D5086_0000061500 [Populus alba]